MSLQIILDKIRAAGDAQIREVEKNAQVQVSGILAQARMEAEQAREDTGNHVSAPAVAECARILHRARLDALHIVGNVREDLVDSAIEQAQALLSNFRADPSYPVILQNLTEEALAQLRISEQDGRPHLLADPRDKALMTDILKDLRLDISVRYELECWGGVTARSEDGRVVVINTLEERLERATPFLRHHLAALFEEPSLHEREAGEAVPTV